MSVSTSHQEAESTSRKLPHSQKKLPPLLPQILKFYCVGITSSLRTLYSNRGCILSSRTPQYELVYHILPFFPQSDQNRFKVQ